MTFSLDSLECLWYINQMDSFRISQHSSYLVHGSHRKWNFFIMSLSRMNTDSFFAYEDCESKFTYIYSVCKFCICWTSSVSYVQFLLLNSICMYRTLIYFIMHIWSVLETLPCDSRKWEYQNLTYKCQLTVLTLVFSSWYCFWKQCDEKNLEPF